MCYTTNVSKVKESEVKMARLNLSIWTPTEDSAWDIKRYLEQFTYIYENTKCIFWNQKDTFRDNDIEGNGVNIIVTWDLPLGELSFYDETLSAYGVTFSKDNIPIPSWVSERTISKFLNRYCLPDLSDDKSKFKPTSVNLTQIIVLPNLKELLKDSNFNLTEYLRFNKLECNVANAINIIKYARKGIGKEDTSNSTCSYTM